MTLDRLGPLTAWDMLRFEVVHALPVSLSVLRERFGLSKTMGILARYVVARDPLRDVPEGRLPPAKERLTRRQLRTVFRLDDALAAAGVSGPDALAAIKAIVGEAGSRFIASNAPLDIEAWQGADQPTREQYAADMTARFPNAVYDELRATANSLDFDVTYCRLAELCRVMDRPHLAPLFCFADAVYFRGGDRPSLVRDTTIADGDDRCRFRIHVG